MKQNIHPDYHEITVKMTNGKTFKTRSTYGKEGDTLQLDIDPNTHPAWTGASSFVNEKAGNVAKFNERFGNLKFGAKKTEQPAPQAKQEKAPEPKKEEAAAPEEKVEAPKEESTTE